MRFGKPAGHDEWPEEWETSPGQLQLGHIAGIDQKATRKKKNPIGFAPPIPREEDEEPEEETEQPKPRKKRGATGRSRSRPKRSG